MGDYVDRDALLALDIAETDVDRLLRDTPLTGTDGRPVVEAERLPELLTMLDGEDPMTTATRNGFPADPRGAAALYLERGLAPVPLPDRSKNPGYPGWEKLHLTADTLDQHFPPQELRNVGILNGAPSSNVLDVDLDCLEARRIAPMLLPATGWIFGRQSSPRSHWIYKVDAALDRAQDTFEDLDGTMLMELRGNGGLTVYPPSTHLGTGEQIRWEHFTDPGEISLADLQRAVGELAAATLLARHWPAKGTRDKTAMALSGALLRRGWSDEKVSGFVRAVAVAAGDEEAGMRAGKASPAARKLEDGDEVTGWPTVMKTMGRAGVEVIKRVQEWLGLTGKPLPEIPLPTEPPWPAPLAMEAYYGLAGEAVQALSPATEADPAALLFQILTAFGSVIGRGPHFTVEADQHHANEYVVLIGRTSKGRKGTSWGQALGLLAPADTAWAGDCVQSGLSSGEGLIWAVRDPIVKHERMKDQGEVRFEEIETDPGISDKRLLVFEPELANVLKQVERQGNTLSPVIRQAWDSGTLRTLTKNTPARATGAHISIVGHITEEELRRYLSVTESANGFANRFLWVCVDRSKFLPEGGAPDGKALERLRIGLAEAVAFARGAGQVRRDDASREIWCAVYAELSEGKPGLTGALLGRSEAHVMRLAMLYALLDRSVIIQPPHLLAALACWQYVEESVRHVFGESLGDRLADDLLRLLRSCADGMTRTDMMTYFGRNQPSGDIGRALGLLARYKLARCEMQSTGGRPAERWFAMAPGMESGDLFRKGIDPKNSAKH